MKKIILFSLLILALPVAFSASNLGIANSGTLGNSDTNSPQQSIQSSILELRGQLATISSQLANSSTQDSINNNFAQLDARISTMTFQQVVLIIAVLVINDALIIGLYLLLKSKEVI